MYMVAPDARADGQEPHQFLRNGRRRQLKLLILLKASE